MTCIIQFHKSLGGGLLEAAPSCYSRALALWPNLFSHLTSHCCHLPPTLSHTAQKWVLNTSWALTPLSFAQAVPSLECSSLSFLYKNPYVIRPCLSISFSAKPSPLQPPAPVTQGEKLSPVPIEPPSDQSLTTRLSCWTRGSVRVHHGLFLWHTQHPCWINKLDVAP